MARKKHSSSHKAAGAGKAVRKAGKVSIATNKLAATVAAVAVTGAFGAGAYALTQDSSAFNPDGFASAYGKDAQDSSKGYQATTEQTDAQANRHDDTSQDKDRSAEESPNKDAFSELPNNGSGTTAVAVDANAKPGTSTVINDGKGDGGSPDGSGDTPNGPVIDNGGDSGDGDNGDSSGGSDTPGNDNSGVGPADTPVAPDTPTKPSNPSNGGANGGGISGDENSQTEQETEPTVPSPSEIPVAPSEKDQESSNLSPVVQPIQNASVTFSPDATLHPMVDMSGESSKIAYKGQLVSGWDLFCSLSTKFGCVDGNDVSIYAWACSQSEFANYDYFRIDGILDSEGNLLPVDPTEASLTIPDGPFELQYEYRYAKDGEFTVGTVEYTPVDYRVYIVDGSSDGKVIETLSGTQDIDLNCYIQDVLSATGGLAQDGKTLNGTLVSGWKSDEGTVVDSMNYHPQGVHVVAAKTLRYDSDQFEIEALSKFKSDYGIDSAGSDLTCWQVLTAINYVDSASRTLNVPKGVQLIELDEAFAGLSKTVLPSTLCSLDGSKLGSAAYELANDNLHLVVDGETGIVSDERGTAYLAIPSGATTLTVSASASKVCLPCECAIKTVTFEPRDGSGLPDINCDVLSGADVRLDVSDFDAFANEYAANFNQKAGNTITSVSGNKSDSYHIEMGMLLSKDGALAKFLYSKTSMANLRGVTKLHEGCFADNDGLETVILPEGDCVFAKDCFANNGSLKQIVCSSVKQSESVDKRLGADGIEDVTVTVAKTSSGGYAYFNDSSNGVVVVGVPEGVVEFTGELGDGLTAKGIAPFAFENNTSLKWVTTDSVVYIGSNAFRDCTSLEGVFLDERATVTLENDPFIGCSALGFVVSNAREGIVNGDIVQPNSRCAMYCPTENVGYCPSFSFFDEQSQVGDYKLVSAGDGYVVYGCSAQAGGEPWLCLKASSTLSGQVELPSSTVEIFTSAFEGVSGVFEVNWGDLDKLCYIDSNAFCESGIAGMVTLGANSWQNMMVSSGAFQRCTGITSVESPLSSLSLDWSVFNECTSLSSVSLSMCATGDGFGVMLPNMFYGCDNLKEISFDGSNPPDLLLASKGSAYRFNLGWSDGEAEAEVLHINVPEDLRESYLNKWVPLFAGYESYVDYKQKVFWDLLGETGFAPSDEEVIAATNEQLLPVENRLRKMMGMDSVDELSIQHSEVVDGCVFEYVDNSMALVSVSDQAGDTVDLDQLIPASCSDVTIKADAFASAPGVKTVVMSDKVGAIESGAFNGLSDLELVFSSASIPDLAAGSVDNPFVFGAEGMRISVDLIGFEDAADKSAADENFKTDLLVSWPVQSLGFESDFDVYRELVSDYMDDDWNIDKVAMGAMVDGLLLPQENYFRYLLDMPSIASTADLKHSFSYDFLHLEKPSVTSGQEDKLPADIDATPAPGTGEIGTGSDGEPMENPNGDKEESDGGDNGDIGGEGGNTQEPGGEGSGKHGDENASTGQGGSAGEGEGGLGESSEEIAE